MTSKRISEFVEQTTFVSTDQLNIIRGSTNYKIPVSGLTSLLGVTGTIVPVGTAGVPVLEQPTAILNNIRTIEDGNGISAGISATNGITIAHNFTQDETGVEIVEDLASASPTFASLIPGAGMQITRVGDVITITATGAALPATKVVNVNVIGDFPAPDTGVITLEADTVYVISNAISTANRFVMSNGTTVTGWSSAGPTFEYTGSGVMFTGADVNCIFLNVQISCPSGTAFNFTRTTGFSAVVINNVGLISCATVAVFNAYITSIINFRVTFATQGILYTGAILNATILELSLFSLSASFVGIDFGTATSDNIAVDRLSVTGVAGAVGVNGAAGDANLTATGFATVSNSRFRGVVIPLTGIVVPDDVQWQFTGNQAIEDTMLDALLSMQGNAVATVIGTQSVGVLVAGTWVIEQVSQMTATTAGRATYNPAKDSRAPITASVTVEPVSGGTVTLGVCIAINGTIIPNSLRTSATSAGNPITISCPWQETLTTGDYTEVFVSNESNTTNILVSSAILRVN